MKVRLMVHVNCILSTYMITIVIPEKYRKPFHKYTQ